MADGAPTATPMSLPPELLQTVAEAIGTALAQQPEGMPGQPPQLTPTQAGQAIGAALAPVAAPILVKARNRLLSRRLWVTIVTIAGLLAQNPLGLQLHPAAQVAIAALAAVYAAAQSLVDSAKGGGNA